jgi:hypothetical protein
MLRLHAKGRTAPSQLRYLKDNRPRTCLLFAMGTLTCPNTGRSVEGWLAEGVSQEDENTYYTIECAACACCRIGATAGIISAEVDRLDIRSDMRFEPRGRFDRGRDCNRKALANRRRWLRNAAKMRPSTHTIRGGNSAEVI